MTTGIVSRQFPNFKTRLHMFHKLVPAWLIMVLAIAAGQVAADQPNILFLFADDHSFDSVHVLGNDQIQTPNLDGLARSGTIMTRAYNMGAWGGAVCVASRTMLNTGRFVWNAHQLKLKQEQESRRTWPQLMKSAGYETYFTGKWHVGLKPVDLFDHVGQVRGGMPRQTPAGYNRPLADQTDDWQPWDKSRGGFWQGGKHWTEVVADDAIGFLEQAKSSSKPFFMYVAFNAPHDPRQSPKEFVDRYPAEKIRVPVDYQDQYPFAEQIGCGPNLRDEKLAPFPRTHHAVQVHRQEYYAIITHMDREIGRILDKLKQLGLDDSTYVFFTADHGLACGHHGLMGKQNMYEHSLRVPFFVRGPEIPAGNQLNARIYLQDVMATSLEIAGAEKPDFVAFNSVLPLIRQQRDRQYDSIYGAYTNKQRAVIKDDWKLIVYPDANVERLYDLKNDPLEQRDLAQDPQQQDRIQGLFQELKRLQHETGDQLELSLSAEQP